MTVKLRIALWKPLEQPGDILGVHAPVLQQAEHGAGVPHSGPAQTRAGPCAEEREDDGVAQTVNPVPARQTRADPERIPSQADRGNRPRLSLRAQQTQNRRVEMHVEMPVDMVEDKAGLSESGELGGDFLPQNLAEAVFEEIQQSGANRVMCERLLRADQARGLLRCECGPAADKGQMQAHTQTRVRLGEPGGLGARRFVDHEAGRGQNALAVRPDHRLVDGVGTPEIIGIHDQASRDRARLRPSPGCGRVRHHRHSTAGASEFRAVGPTP